MLINSIYKIILKKETLLPGISLRYSKAPVSGPSTPLLHVLEEVFGEVSNLFLARVNRVGIMLKQGMGIVDNLIVLIRLNDSHHSGEISSRGAEVHEHFQSSNPDLMA